MTISQNIFNGLSADWKWASMASNGVARVHTDKPTISADNVVLFKLGKRHTALRGEFDATEMPAEGLTPVIVERSTLASPPPYATDGKGVALDQPVSCEPMAPRVPECPQPSAFAPAPQPMAPPATFYITVDQAEAGSLWDFANPDENYVSVNQYGVVWFNTHKDGCGPRRSYSVEVTGVTHSIERTRSQPRFAPPEAGKPFATLAVDYPAPGLREDGNDDEAHSWANELDEAKERAQRLLGVYVHDGSNERPALNEMQYMAIFGELPE